VLVEFTGERVIPGQVNDDLWSEHLARYAFARRLVAEKSVLDAGCGTGYGSAELARSARFVTGIDLAPEAIHYAHEHYSAAGLRFLVSSVTAMPFPANAFQAIVAFEVIEHLADYRAFLEECARVLSHQGLLIVSSPNKRYYAETRAETGPNPYHQHEFEPEEFTSELTRVFVNVRLLLQNRTESFTFHPASAAAPAEACIAAAAGIAEEAHFLIALCSFGPLPDPRSFIYVPKAANLLRERERHIGLLEEELNRSRQWLADTQAERDGMIELFRRQKEELEQSNRWAEQLNTGLNIAGERIADLQNEAVALRTGYESKIKQLEEETRAQIEWVSNIKEELESKCQELSECVRLLDAAEATVKERTLWAQRAEAQRQELAAHLDLLRASRWLKLGRKLGLGPAVKQG
jgi:ubiquinone/menaquinone biosynthesis C-methylase UbiE